MLRSLLPARDTNISIFILALHSLLHHCYGEKRYLLLLLRLVYVIMVKICIFIPSLCLIRHGHSPISILFTTPWSWQKQFWFQHHSHYVLIATKITITFVLALRSLNCSIYKKKNPVKSYPLGTYRTGGRGAHPKCVQLNTSLFMFFAACLSYGVFYYL